MARKPETTFIASVHAHLRNKLHFEKTNNPYRSGMPDVWYSGPLGDLWIEYKYIETVPSRANVLPNLSALQAKWLNDRYDEGRNVAVIVGCPAGGVFYLDKTWNETLTPEEFNELIQTRKDLASDIITITGVNSANSTNTDNSCKSSGNDT